MKITVGNGKPIHVSHGQKVVLEQGTGNYRNRVKVVEEPAGKIVLEEQGSSVISLKPATRGE